MVAETQQIMEELKEIKEELTYIKIHMVDRDMFLDKEEKQLLKESYENEKQEELISQEELEKEMGL